MARDRSRDSSFDVGRAARRALLWCATCALALGSSPLLAAPAETGAVAAILSHALAPSPLAEDLRRLTDETGGRVSGTPAMARAVDWATAAFRAAGVDVHTESYSLPVTWQEEHSQVLLTGPVQFPVSIVSVAWAPSTAAGGIAAPLVDVADGSEADFVSAGTAVQGAILLVHSNVLVTWADLSEEYFRAPAIIQRAIARQARAILWISSREHRLLYRHTDAVAAELAKLPMGIVAREDGLRLARVLAAYPGQERAQLSIENRIGGPVLQYNVVGEIKGRERPDEFVILGAHLDSWELGTGALDNGCNAAMVIAVARALKAAGVHPKRTLRFILFSGEEQGLVGSRMYVQQHQAELDRTSAVIVYDSGAGRVTGYSLGGRADIQAGVTQVLEPLSAWGVNTHTLDASTGTDNLDFLLEGVPTLVANQDESNYMPNYHAASDTLDKVDLRNVQLHVAIAALTAWGIAERRALLGARQSRQEIEALMKTTGLEQQLKTLGYWPEWQSGARGRHP